MMFMRLQPFLVFMEGELKQSSTLPAWRENGIITRVMEEREKMYFIEFN